MPTDRRAALLESLADHVLTHGLATASLRPLARAASTSDRMLLYYFPTKADLIAAILETIAARLTAILSAATAEPQPLAVLRQSLVESLSHEALWPYMRIWLEVAAGAARGDPLLARVGQAIGRGFLAWGESQLLSANAQARTREAAQLLVFIEGALFLKSVGLADVTAEALASGSTQSPA
jgi:AcrR family transcriptional regulator